MNILNREDVLINKGEIISEIKKGKIFVYPTDTIYGLGANAENSESVRKIREIKRRDEKPFSVIFPSFERVLVDCDIEEDDFSFIRSKLPGPYTFFVEMKKNSHLSREINPKEMSVGVRMPNHWFWEVIKESNIPFVTTSVNISGEKHMSDIDSLSDKIKEQIDYLIYEGKKDGLPSEKIDIRRGLKK